MQARMVTIQVTKTFSGALMVQLRTTWWRKVLPAFVRAAQQQSHLLTTTNDYSISASALLDMCVIIYSYTLGNFSETRFVNSQLRRCEFGLDLPFFRDHVRHSWPIVPRYE